MAYSSTGNRKLPISHHEGPATISVHRLDRESDMAALLEATRPALKDVLGKVYSMSRDQVTTSLLNGDCRVFCCDGKNAPPRPPTGVAAGGVL